MSDPSPTSETTTALLRHFAWAPASKVPGRYEVWTREGTPDEILVPLDPGRGDFDALIRRAVQTLFARYGDEVVRIQTLLQMRLSAALDSTQWRKQTSIDAGLIAWDEGEALFGAAKASLIAAAKATREKRMHHGSASGYIARQFLERTLMGQTEIGSFIITAHTPANQRFHVSKRSENRAAEDFRQAEMVSGRAIVETLQRSIEAVRSALDEYRTSPNLDGFVPLVEDGVSAELVNALATLTSGGDAAVTIERFEADTTVLDAQVDRPIREIEIAFDAVESTVLESVAKRFQEAPPAQAVRLRGEVSALDNSTTSPHRLIRLDVSEGADVRHARVRLSPEQYDLAIAAHRDQVWLSVSGSLERDGRDYWLYNAEGVALVDASEGPLSRPVEIFTDADDGLDDADPDAS